MLSLPTASPSDRREVTELTSILLSAEPASTAAAGVSEPADSQIHRRKGKCVSGGAPVQHPPPSSLCRVRHGRPQPDVALWHAAALPQLVPHPLLSLPEGGKPGMGGRERAAAPQRSA